MTAIYKVLSAVLSYPESEFQSAVRELIGAVDQDDALPPIERGALLKLILEICEQDLLEAQAAYVDLFDRSRSLSLHLFEHVHGESRDRGQAMVSLRERYMAAGFDLAGNELPDYLPLYLEFLAELPEDEAREMLAQTAPILGAISERLKRRESPYAAAFDALLALSNCKPAVELPEIEENERDFATIDKAWEEAEVRFGPGDAKTDACPRAAEIVGRFGQGRKVAGGAQ